MCGTEIILEVDADKMAQLRYDEEMSRLVDFCLEMGAGHTCTREIGKWRSLYRTSIEFEAAEPSWEDLW